MKRYLNYIKYVLRHKWFVFRAGLVIGAPIWRLLVHDMSKFRPSELVPYAKTFYDVDGTGNYVPTYEFNEAWLQHIHRNPHHWQFWILRFDDGGTKKLHMPKEYVLEMVADWAGAGRAITGKWDVMTWYENTKDKRALSSVTQLRVERALALFSESKLATGTAGGAE